MAVLRAIASVIAFVARPPTSYITGAIIPVDGGYRPLLQPWRPRSSARAVTSSLGGYALADADAPLVAEVCRRLDGIALAIEFAAGRLAFRRTTPVATKSKLPSSKGCKRWI